MSKYALSTWRKTETDEKVYGLGHIVRSVCWAAGGGNYHPYRGSSLGRFTEASK